MLFLSGNTSTTTENFTKHNITKCEFDNDETWTLNTLIPRGKANHFGHLYGQNVSVSIYLSKMKSELSKINLKEIFDLLRALIRWLDDQKMESPSLYFNLRFPH